MLKEFVDPKMSRRVGDNSELCFSFEVSVFFLGSSGKSFSCIGRRSNRTNAHWNVNPTQN